MSAQAESAKGGELTSSYEPSRAGFDEFRNASLQSSGHWQTLFEAINALDVDTRFRRMEQLNTRVRETGIAHDLFSDPATTAQPWRVDLVPLLIPPAEWKMLEGALLQRARLLETVLADLYGDQHLLATGTIPHQLVFSVNVMALLEGLSLGVAGGVEPGVMKEILKEGIANSGVLQLWAELGPRWKGMLEATAPGVTPPNLRKDLHTALDLARELGLDLHIGEHASRIADSGKATGHDNAAL
jgi:hypothetical protein